MLQISHTVRDGGKILEFGAMQAGEPVWRQPWNAVAAAYRLGFRYFMWHQGKALEIWLDEGALHDEPTFRTSADKVCDRKLLTLPSFH